MRLFSAINRKLSSKARYFKRASSTDTSRFSVSPSAAIIFSWAGSLAYLGYVAKEIASDGYKTAKEISSDGIKTAKEISSDGIKTAKEVSSDGYKTAKEIALSLKSPLSDSVEEKEMLKKVETRSNKLWV